MSLLGKVAWHFQYNKSPLQLSEIDCSYQATIEKVLFLKICFMFGLLINYAWETLFNALFKGVLTFLYSLQSSENSGEKKTKLNEADVDGD